MERSPPGTPHSRPGCPFLADDHDARPRLGHRPRRGQHVWETQRTRPGERHRERHRVGHGGAGPLEQVEDQVHPTSLGVPATPGIEHQHVDAQRLRQLGEIRERWPASARKSRTSSSSTSAASAANSGARSGRSIGPRPASAASSAAITSASRGAVATPSGQEPNQTSRSSGGESCDHAASNSPSRVSRAARAGPLGRAQPPRSRSPARLLDRVVGDLVDLAQRPGADQPAARSRARRPPGRAPAGRRSPPRRWRTPNVMTSFCM